MIAGKSIFSKIEGVCGVVKTIIGKNELGFWSKMDFQWCFHTIAKKNENGF